MDNGELESFVFVGEESPCAVEGGIFHEIRAFWEAVARLTDGNAECLHATIVGEKVSCSSSDFEFFGVPGCVFRPHHPCKHNSC